jgi:signal transduction histidine kinase
MKITDSGCGIPEELLREWREMRAPLGVGMAGMLERTRDMDGSFDVQSGYTGTTLTIIIPVTEPEVKAYRADADGRDSTRRVSAA